MMNILLRTQLARSLVEAMLRGGGRMTYKVTIEPAAKRGWFVAKVNGAPIHTGRNERAVENTARYLLQALPAESIAALINACERRNHERV
jgi:hypothetical protein